MTMHEMVSGFLLPKTTAQTLNKYANYSLYLLTPPAGIATVIPVGHIWYQRGLKRWKTTLGRAQGYFLVKENGFAVGTLFVENRVALKFEWLNNDD